MGKAKCVPLAVKGAEIKNNQGIFAVSHIQIIYKYIYMMTHYFNYCDDSVVKSLYWYHLQNTQALVQASTSMFTSDDS